MPWQARSQRAGSAPFETGAPCELHSLSRMRKRRTGRTIQGRIPAGFLPNHHTKSMQGSGVPRTLGSKAGRQACSEARRPWPPATFCAIARISLRSGSVALLRHLLSL
jgi:hypothetical protein